MISQNILLSGAEVGLVIMVILGVS